MNKYLEIYSKTSIDYDELGKEFEISFHIPIQKLLLQDVYGDVMNAVLVQEII